MIDLAHLLHIGYVQTPPNEQTHTHTHVKAHDSTHSKYRWVNNIQSHNEAASTTDKPILVVSKGTQNPNHPYNDTSFVFVH